MVKFCRTELGVWILLILLCIIAIERVGGLTNPSTSSIHHTIWNEQGIVSLASLDTSKEKEEEIVAGTKRGRLHLFQWDASGKTLAHKGEIVDSMHTRSASVPYPIYSLISYYNDETQTQQLFCGSGDRFLSVWNANNKNRQGHDDWSKVQQLGPHTGWVKALAMDPSSGLLHSIGCNCIETWEPSFSSKQRDDGGNSWKHKKKRSIESSPDQGSTLSSDLLCLSAWNEWLFSGGVDGRIHIWSSDPNHSLQPLQSMAAHQGRVSALGVTPIWNQTACLVFSTGHDGMLQCRKLCLTNKGSSERWDYRMDDDDDDDGLLGSTAIVDQEGFPTRVTAMACKWKDNNTVQVLLGSATGTLHQLCVSTNTRWETCSILKEGPKVELDRESIIYAISIASWTDPKRTLAVVGHSKGLSTVAWTEEP